MTADHMVPGKDTGDGDKLKETHVSLVECKGPLVAVMYSECYPKPNIQYPDVLQDHSQSNIHFQRLGRQPFLRIFCYIHALSPPQCPSISVFCNIYDQQTPQCPSIYIFCNFHPQHSLPSISIFRNIHVEHPP